MSKRSVDGGEVFDSILPGRVVEIHMGEGMPPAKVSVFPLGIRHFKKFRAAIGAIFGALQGADVGRILSGSDELRFDGMQDLVQRALPAVMDEGLDLVASCCKVAPYNGQKVTFDDLPHWATVAVVEAWLAESFGGEGLRPWKAAIERGMQKLTGRPFSISEIRSKLSSLPAMNATTSSTDDSPASPSEDGRGPNTSPSETAPASTTTG